MCVIDFFKNRRFLTTHTILGWIRNKDEIYIYNNASALNFFTRHFLLFSSGEIHMQYFPSDCCIVQYFPIFKSSFINHICLLFSMYRMENIKHMA